MSRLAKMLFTRRLCVAAVILVALGFTAGAWAYFSSHGTGTAAGSVGTLPAPVLSVTSGAGTATLSWNAVTAPASGTVSYYVTRNGGSPSSGCPSSASTSQTTGCTDTGLTAGTTYTYTVTAVWQSWKATSNSAQAMPTSATATKLVLSAASTSPTAGASDNLTITAEDDAGNVVTSYTGTKSLKFTGASAIGSYNPTVTNNASTPAAIGFGSFENITFASGVASATTTGATGQAVMALYKAGTASIVVSDGTINNGTGLSVTVAPKSADSGGNLSLSAASTSVTAGASDNLTITAIDQYGNTDTTYIGAKSLKFTGASAVGSYNPTVTNNASTPAAIPFGTSENITFASGVATTTTGGTTGQAVMTLYQAGTPKIVVSDGTATNGSGLSITVAAKSATSFSLSAASTSPTAGAGDNLTITALDQYGNTDPSYTGTKTLTFSGASAIGSYNPTVTNNASTPAAIAFGNAESITFASGVASPTTTGATGQAVMTLYKAGAASIVVSTSTLNNGTGLSVTVAPKTADSGGNLSLSATSTSPTAGSGDNLTITAFDQYGNTDTNYTGAKTLTFSGASTIGTYSPTVTNSNRPTAQAISFGTGVGITFTGGTASPSTGGASGQAVMTLYKVETAHIVVSDGTISNGTGLSVTVAPNSTSSGGSFSLSAASTNPSAGSGDDLTITALDQYGNTDTSYSGAKSLTFSGASAIGTHNPTVTNNASTPAAIAFSTAENITFASGIASPTTTGATGQAVMALYKAGTASIVVSAGTISNGTGLSVFVNSAGVTLSYSPACPSTMTKNTSVNLSISIPSDSYGNAFTTQTSATFGLSLSGTNVSSFGFGTVGTTTQSLSVTSGPSATTGFTIAESQPGGGSKTASLTMPTVPAGFTAPASCTITAS